MARAIALALVAVLMLGGCTRSESATDAGPQHEDAGRENPDAGPARPDAAEQADASAPDASASASCRTPAECYAAASSTCAAMPLRTTGTTYYFCDCQDGAEAGCAGHEGNDTNYDTHRCDAAHPCQTWTQAIQAFNAMNEGDTIALCKGGFWNVPGGSSVAAGCGYSPHPPQISNPRCSAETSLTDPKNPSTCDIRDYQASWGGTARPVLYAYQTLPTTLLAHGNTNTTNGVRILNLEFRGQDDGPGDAVSLEHRGIYTAACAASTQHSWLVCNNDFNHLRIGWQGGDYDTQASTHGAQSDWVVWGNRFTFIDLDAILGGVGTNARIDANFFDNVGCWDPPYTAFAHVVYISDYQHTAGKYVSGVRIVNNEMRYSTGTAQQPTCNGVLLVGHDYYDGLLVENNLIDAGPNPRGNAWGIGFSAAGSGPTSYRNAIIRGNRIQAGGTGIAMGSAPGTIIENNVILAALSPSTSHWGFGIDVPSEKARPQDTRTERVIIRNNTIYLASPAHSTRTGILMRQEGSGHVIANNAVYSTSGLCWRTLMGHCSVTTTQECTGDTEFYDNGMGLGGCPGGESCVEDTDRWSFLGNNSCYGGASWDDTPASSPITGNPLFTNPPTDFRPVDPGSPLIRVGDATYGAKVDFNLATRPNPPSIGAIEP